MLAQFALSRGFLAVMIMEFVAGSALAAWERNWPMCLYFGGAAVLNFGLLSVK